MALNSNDVGNEMDWQSGIGTIQDRMKCIWETGFDSDVQFLLGTGKELEDGKEEKQLIKAHKFILKMGSSVFAAQFRFDKFSNQDEDAPIEVKDIKASAFNAMLNFLYTNDISAINQENIVGVYIAAKKYLLNSLTQKCIEIAGTKLDKKNVFDMLKMAKLHGETVLVDHCWKFIDDIDRFWSEEFYGLCHEEMGEILGRDSLRTKNEWNLFFHLVKWAAKQCENAGIREPTGEQLRAEMGSLLYTIRFPLISPMEFINFIVPKGILNNSEVAAMLRHYTREADNDQRLPFSAQPRANSPRQHNKLVDKLVSELLRTIECAKKDKEIEGKNAEIEKKNAEINKNKKEIEEINKENDKLRTENEQLKRKVNCALFQLRTVGGGYMAFQKMYNSGHNPNPKA